jgi:hypothetical protein
VFSLRFAAAGAPVPGRGGGSLIWGTRSVLVTSFLPPSVKVRPIRNGFLDSTRGAPGYGRLVCGRAGDDRLVRAGAFPLAVPVLCGESYPPRPPVSSVN